MKQEETKQFSLVPQAQLNYTKNSFIISHNGFSFQKAVSKTVKELEDVLKYLQENESFIYKNEIIQPKYYKILKRYKPLLIGWSATRLIQPDSCWVIPQFFNNYLIERILKLPENQKIKNLDPKKKQYWDHIIKIHDQRLKEITNRKLQSVKSKNKQQNKQSSTVKLLEEKKITDKKTEGPHLTTINPHLMQIVNLLSQNMQLNIFLPTIIKIKLLGIKELDQTNERAVVSLQIQLKTKIPFDTSTSFQQILRRQILYVKSGKFKRQEGIPIIFQNQYNQIAQEASIWNDLSAYYSYIENWKDQIYDKISEKMDVIDQERIIVFRTITESISKICTHDFNSPFDILDVQGTIQLFPIYTVLQEWQQQMRQFFDSKLNNLNPLLAIKLNFIDVENEDKLGCQIFSQKNIQIDSYRIANSLIHIEITNSETAQKKLTNNLISWKWDSINQNKQEKPTQNMRFLYKGDCFAHYHFPIYRDPINPLTAIFVTNVVLGVIMFFVFFQNPQDLADRIANISALLISFVAMIAILQEQMKRSKLSITAILVYLMILTPLFCMADTIYLYQRPQIQNNPVESPLFWICVGITALNIIYPLFMTIIYICCLKPRFNKNYENRDDIMPGDQSLDDVEKNKLANLKNFDKILRMSVEPSYSRHPLSKQITSYAEETYFMIMKNAYEEVQKLGNMYARLNKYFEGERKEIFLKIINNQLKSDMRLGGIVGIQSRSRNQVTFQTYQDVNRYQQSNRQINPPAYGQSYSRANQYNNQNYRLAQSNQSAPYNYGNYGHNYVYTQSRQQNVLSPRMQQAQYFPSSRQVHQQVVRINNSRVPPIYQAGFDRAFPDSAYHQGQVRNSYVSGIQERYSQQNESLKRSEQKQRIYKSSY